MIGLPQPSSFPRRRPKTSPNRPAVSVARPGTSTRGARGSLDSRTSRSVIDQHDDADRDVDQEHPAPVERGGERPADRRADRERRADRGAVGGERAGPLALVRERVGQQRERGREHDRGAEALDGARGVEHLDRAGGGADAGRDGEDDEPGREDAAAAEAVGERARGEDDGGERERVRVDDPLQTADPGLEVFTDRRQRGVHHRDVQHQDRGGGADHHEGPALHCGHVVLSGPGEETARMPSRDCRSLAGSLPRWGNLATTDH